MSGEGKLASSNLFEDQGPADASMKAALRCKATGQAHHLCTVRLHGGSARSYSDVSPVTLIPAHPLGEGKRKFWRFLKAELVAWLLAKTNGTEAALRCLPRKLHRRSCGTLTRPLRCGLISKPWLKKGGALKPWRSTP
jgi:hypothetical protein